MHCKEWIDTGKKWYKWVKSQYLYDITTPDRNISSLPLRLMFPFLYPGNLSVVMGLRSSSIIFFHCSGVSLERSGFSTAMKAGFTLSKSMRGLLGTVPALKINTEHLINLVINVQQVKLNNEDLDTLMLSLLYLRQLWLIWGSQNAKRWFFGFFRAESLVRIFLCYC